MFTEVHYVDEALSILLSKMDRPSLQAESVPLRGALGRVSARRVLSPMDFPPYDRAAMDGLAVRAEDTYGASPYNPIELRIVGRAEAGQAPSELPELGPREAVIIYTGAPMPGGADAVVMREHCSVSGALARVTSEVRPLQNVSLRGEDYAAGEPLLEAGTLIRPWHVAALASMGFSYIEVLGKLRAAVLSTGNELVEPGAPLGPGQIYNSTKPMLLCLLEEEGCEPIDLGTVGDEPEAIRSAVEKALGAFDLLITTGGSSVGEKDVVVKALSYIEGFRLLAHGIRIRPGRPTGLALLRGTPVFVLSGFPVAALAAFDALIRPTIYALYGARPAPRPNVRARLTRRVSNHASSRCYIRVRVHRQDGELVAEPFMLTGSGLLSTLTKANGIIILAEDMEGLDEGEEAEVQLIGPIEGA